VGTIVTNPVVKQGFPTIIQSEALFTDAKRKPVKSLNGIAVDLIVSTHELEGDSVIEGEIPDTALVIVKHGSLTVNGYVNGSVVAEGDIVVKGNITGGYVISTRGSITAEQALSGSRVISFVSNVLLEAAEHPACVFAWHGITVAKDIFGGRFVASDITVRGKVSGGELHSTGRIVVDALEAPGHGATLVCLRDEISCEEFGRPMGQDERKLRRSIGKFQYAKTTSARLVRYAEHDIQDSHLTFLYMLLCARLDAQKMSVMRGLQAQSNFLKEIAGTCDQLISFFSESWKNAESAAEEYDALAEQCIASLSALNEDIIIMANAFRLQHKPYILGACDDIAKTLQGLKRQQLTKVTALSVIARLRDRKTRCEELRQELASTLEDAVRAMGLDPAVAQSVESQPHKAEIMLETVRAKVERDTNNPRYTRLRSPLARLLQNTVDRSRKNIQHWRTGLEETETQLRDILGRLGANSTTLFAAAESGATYFQCNTSDPGVVIVGAPKNGLDPVQTASSSITISEPIQAPTRYQLHNLEIQRRAVAR
jgi:hypothetical protein